MGGGGRGGLCSWVGVLVYLGTVKWVVVSVNSGHCEAGVVTVVVVVIVNLITVKWRRSL